MNDFPGVGGSSFERMRAMLLRAAEIREDEQTQVFDALDEIMARLATLDALGTIRKRVVDMPDREQVNEVAEQVRHAVTTLGTVDGTLGSLAPAVEAMPERITPAVTQLRERVDTLLGRMDALAGRVDGMEKRLGATANDVGTTRSELGGLRAELGRLPENVADAVRRHLRESVTAPVTEDLQAVRDALAERVDGVGSTLAFQVTEERAAAENRNAERIRAEADRVATAVGEDVAGARSELKGELAGLTAATRALDERLGAVRAEMTERFDAALAAVNAGVDRMCGEVAARPDAEALTGSLRAFADEMARHHREALDEAMATFAELTVTPAPVSLPLARTTPEHPRRSQVRRRPVVRRTVLADTGDEDEDTPGDE